MKNLIIGGLSLFLIAAKTPVVFAEIGDKEAKILVSQASTSEAKLGNFVSGEHETAGGVRIFKENGKNYLELDANFQTNNGPDLFVILHRSDDVIGTSSSAQYSIKEEDYALIAPLEKVNGSQVYMLPDNINPDDYQSVAIWCRQFNATFGAAKLTRI